MSVFINFRRAQKFALFQFEKKISVLKKEVIRTALIYDVIVPGNPGMFGI